MKAYRDENGKITLFRPDMNMAVRPSLHALRLNSNLSMTQRMNRSAARVSLPVC